MDVAVCISGEFRNNVDLCRESIQKYLPYEQFTHTWADTPLPELPSSGHVAWWVCLHKYLGEQFINNDSVCKLERDIVD